MMILVNIMIYIVCPPYYVQIRRAHVVCIVYAVDDEDTLDSVTDHWLPFVRRTLGSDAHTTPVILVGNKVDLVDYSTMESVLPIMNEFEEIETCVECSARNLKNISEMFYFAQKAILHPSAPLWSYHQKDVSPLQRSTDSFQFVSYELLTF